MATLVADGFEQVELTGPRKALDAAGATTHLISPAEGQGQGFNHDTPGDKLPVDLPLSGGDPASYDALLLPGGVANPDKLRVIPEAVSFVKASFEAGKPLGAICHEPWTLIEAGVVKGVTMTSRPSLQTGLRDAGANWVDQEVVTDKGLVTSRKPDNIPAFSKKFIEEFAEGKHAGQQEKAA